MRKLILVFSLFFLNGCDYLYVPPSDEFLIKKAQDNYYEYVRSSNESWKCLSSEQLLPDGVDRKRYIRVSCNAGIDALQGNIKFSEFKVYRHKDHSSVCGVASGLTPFKQKIGIRLVVTDKDLEKFTWKRSNYDFAYLPYSNSDLAKSLKKIMHDELQRYVEAEKTECRKD